MSAIETTTPIPTGTWKADPAHTTVGFAVKHLGIATVRGSFDTFDATLEVGESVADAKITASIDAASINTAEEQRDAHLRSADFFDAETYPQLTFESTAIRPAGDERLTVSGELTMHGVTRPIELEATIEGLETDPWGNERVGLELSGQLSRGDFGMTFNQALGSGNVLVSDKVRLSFDVSAVKQAA